VPIKKDGSDLEEKLYWCLNNDEECCKIANAGKEYMKNYCNKERTDRVFERFLELYPQKI
jgi:hypothetical protein